MADSRDQTPSLWRRLPGWKIALPAISFGLVIFLGEEGVSRLLPDTQLVGAILLFAAFVITLGLYAWARGELRVSGFVAGLLACLTMGALLGLVLWAAPLRPVDSGDYDTRYECSRLNAQGLPLVKAWGLLVVLCAVWPVHAGLWRLEVRGDWRGILLILAGAVIVHAGLDLAMFGRVRWLTSLWLGCA